MTRCMRIDCQAEATHALKLVVPDARSSDTSAEGLLGVSLCATHCAEATAKPFLERNPAIEALLCSVCEEGTEPDFDEAYIEGVPLGSLEHKAWQAAERVSH